MSQEMNKKAVADLFCIEDARAVCEAIGGLGLNPNDEAADEPLDYTPDNILDVTVNENPDGMPAFPQLGQKEMDGETQAFVVDELAKQLQADGRESLTEEDLIPFMVKIKGENNISQDLTSFLDQITSNTDSRLATQNVSEAQPNGVATDLSKGGEGEAPAADPLAAAGMGELPPEAPGGLAEPTEAPALNANPDDALSLDAPGAEAGAEGDFNLDVPEPGAEVGAEGGDDSFNLDIGDEGGEAPADDGKESDDKKDDAPSKDSKDDEDEKKKYSLLESQYEELQTEFSALQEKYNSLLEFKEAAESKEKMELINSFYMLSEEDKKDVVENITKYSLDDIEAKLAVKCLHNGAFNLKEKNEEVEAPVTTFNLENAVSEEDNAPAWIAACRKTRDNR